jgi:hypothetical protein
MVGYKHQDSERDQWVQRLCTDLRSKFGVDAKLDDFEVDYGQSFSDYMKSEIDRECDALLFVITPASVAAVDQEKSGGFILKCNWRMRGEFAIRASTSLASTAKVLTRHRSYVITATSILEMMVCMAPRFVNWPYLCGGSGASRLYGTYSHEID